MYVLKITMQQSWVKQTPPQDSAIEISWSKIFNNDVIVISFAYKNIFTVATLKNPQNDRLYAYPSNKKKQVVTY